MRKFKIRICILVVLLLSLLLVSCQSHNVVKQTEEPIYTEFTTITPSPEPVAYKTEAPAKKTVIAEPTTEAISIVSQIVSETPEPDSVEVEERDKEGFCTLTVRCEDILQNMNNLKSGKEKYLPADGVILPKQDVNFSFGESVFDVLYRVVKEKNIHIEFVNTPVYNSVYIEGIANLYEFDCGKNSGWIYTVNGESPMYGCSQHIINHGDNIEFVYKCNLFA